MDDFWWTRGDDLALVWPGGVVMLPGEVADETATEVWRLAHTGVELGALLQRLTEALGVSLLSMPMFAIALVSDGRAHVAVRGDWSVEVDVADGRRTVRGSGITTWSEQCIDNASGVTLGRQFPVGGAALPIVSGVVRAAGVTGGRRFVATECHADAEEAQDEGAVPVVSGVSPASLAGVLHMPDDAGPVPISDSPSSQGGDASASAVEVELGLAADFPRDADSAPDGGVGSPSSGAASQLDADEPDPGWPAGAADPVPSSGADPTVAWDADPTARWTAAVEADEAEPGEEAASVGDDSVVSLNAVEAPPEVAAAASTSSGTLHAALTHELLEMAAPEADVISSVPGRERNRVPGVALSVSSHTPTAEFVDHDGATVVDFRLPDGVLPAPATGDAPVLALVCPSGHTNRPHVVDCRVCSVSLSGAVPQEVPRPPLGRVRSSTGEVIPLTGPVLVGRSPRASRFTGTTVPRLLALPFPHVSSSHAEIRLEGWSVFAVDLNSRNGTYLRRRDEPPVRVTEPPLMLQHGDVLDFGHGVRLTFEDLP